MDFDMPPPVNNFGAGGAWLLAQTIKTIQLLQEQIAQLFVNFSDNKFIFTKPVKIAPTDTTQQPLGLTPPPNQPLNFTPNNPSQDIQPVNQGDVPQGQGQAAGIATSRTVIIRQINKDTLLVDDPADVTFRGIVVARPWVARGSRSEPLNPDDRADISFVYLGKTYQMRKIQYYIPHHTSDTDPPDQGHYYRFLMPFYMVGRPLVIALVPNGIIDSDSPDLTAAAKVIWMDVNADARWWFISYLGMYECLMTLGDASYDPRDGSYSRTNTEFEANTIPRLIGLGL
jgi:hypothetical protein